MFLDSMACTETVSIFEALILRNGDACIDLGLPSLLGGVAVFIGCVLILRFAAMFVLRRAIPGLRRKQVEKPASKETEAEDGLKPMPYESPIRSTGAWGGKAR